MRTGPQSPAVHALLPHFEAVGFDGAPRFLGIDDEEREILSYVAGEPAQAPVAAGYWAPLRVDTEAVEWRLLLDRRGGRLHLVSDAYVLDADDRSRLLDAHLSRRRLGYEAHRQWGGIERRDGWREMWDAGSGTLILANLDWIEDHRVELDRWL